MPGFQCPYCSIVMPCVKDTTQIRYTSFENADDSLALISNKFAPSSLKLTFFQCPNCGKYSINISGVGKEVEEVNMSFPGSTKHFPDYVPEQILADYQEASAIFMLSPKASATLSRRCIQGMIRNKWNMQFKTLNQEITSLKDKIDPSLWNAIDALRQIGNIGAHMEMDVNTIVEIEPDEAQKLINLVEILIKEWYIIPHEREELLSNIVQINYQKQEDRKKTE